MARKAPKKPKKDVFVLTLPLRASDEDLRIALRNLETVRQIYNAALGESLKRLRKLRDAAEWKEAQLIPKEIQDEVKGAVPNPARYEAFRAARVQFGFTQASIETFAILCKNQAGFGDRLGAPETQRMAQRAFSAVEQYCYGVRGRPRFKGLRGVRSLEGKSDAAALRWRDGHLCYGGMKLKALISEKDAYTCEALSRKICYCRLIRKTIKGKIRLYVQLVLKGKPPQRASVKLGTGRVGMDQGPSNLAVVAQATPEAAAMAHLVRFCATVIQPWAWQRRLERKLDRSRRVSNPENYDAAGRVKPGPKRWSISTRGQRVKRELAESARRLVAERERCHGHLGNEILALGDNFNFEKVSYKAFQKRFGRSVAVRAPGAFFERFKRRAASAGATINEFSTRTTKLSQFCHIAGNYAKKPLSQRRHVFPDGTWVDRDLYSAWLARSVSGDLLDARQAVSAWPAAQLPLRTASGTSLESASGRGLVPRSTAKPSERIVRRRKSRQARASGIREAGGAAPPPRIEDPGCGYAPGRGRPTRLPKAVGNTGETRSFTTG
jgi:putative transposase